MRLCGGGIGEDHCVGVLESERGACSKSTARVRIAVYGRLLSGRESSVNGGHPCDGEVGEEVVLGSVEWVVAEWREFWREHVRHVYVVNEGVEQVVVRVELIHVGKDDDVEDDGGTRSHNHVRGMAVDAIRQVGTLDDNSPGNLDGTDGDISRDQSGVDLHSDRGNAPPIDGGCVGEGGEGKEEDRHCRVGVHWVGIYVVGISRTSIVIPHPHYHVRSSSLVKLEEEERDTVPIREVQVESRLRNQSAAPTSGIAHVHVAHSTWVSCFSIALSVIEYRTEGDHRSVGAQRNLSVISSGKGHCNDERNSFLWISS